MRFNYFQWIVIICTTAILSPVSALAENNTKYRIGVISSYHPEYIWSQQTNDGVIKALLKFGYLDDMIQGEQYTKNDEVESSKAIIKKWWMDTKRKNSQTYIAKTLQRLTKEVDQFAPDLILLGDDNAAKYVGNHYLDSRIPMVFWGVNGIPLKYGLLDSIEKPGHNITGIYQAGYHLESVRYLKTLVPSIKTIAVLSDDSPTGRSHAKKIKRYADGGSLGVQIIKIVITNSFSEWKREALALQEKVDAFYVSTFQTLKDDQERHVNSSDAASWYLEHIHKPEVVPGSFIVKQGLLCTVDDSAVSQGYEAVKVAHSILSGQAEPSEIASYAPAQGPFIVNRWRARQLGIETQLKKNSEIIDQFIDEGVVRPGKEISE